MKPKVCSLLLACLSFILFTACGSETTRGASDSLEIWEKEGTYLVKAAHSGRTLSKHNFANEALEDAISLLGDGGGKIQLGNGRFLFNETLGLKSKLTLTGGGAGTVILPSEEFRDSCLFYGETLDQVTLSEMSLESATDQEKSLSGMILSHCGSCLIKDVTFIGFPDKGVWLTDDTFLSEVRGCRFADVRGSGVLLDRLNGIGRAGPYLPNLVSNCIFYRGGTGIECRHAIVANIVACMVFQSREPAIYIHSESNSILVSGCRTFQIEKDAVVVDNSHEINITGNIICWQIRNGIVLSAVDWGTVSGNNIIDSGNIPFSFSGDEVWEYWQERPESIEEYQHNGISVIESSKGLTIDGNAIFNWASNPPLRYGIFEAEGCMDNLITGNNINYFTEAGIRSLGQGTLVSNNITTPGAHRGNNRGMHSFDTRLIEKFIEEIRSGEGS